MTSTTSPRRFPEPVDYGAAHTSNNELHGHELPKPKVTLKCRKCGEVVTDTGPCPHCAGGGQ